MKYPKISIFSNFILCMNFSISLVSRKVHYMTSLSPYSVDYNYDGVELIKILQCTSYRGHAIQPYSVNKSNSYLGPQV